VGIAQLVERRIVIPEVTGSSPVTHPKIIAPLSRRACNPAHDFILEVAMLSDVQIKRVWEGMLGAEIRSDYFADLSGSYLGKQRLATWSTLFLSSGAAVSFVANIPQDYSFVRPLLACLAAAVSLYSVVMQNQKLAVDASDLHFRWNRLAMDYTRLWEDVYSEDALKTLNALDDRAAELSKSGTSFPNREKKMLRWQTHVEQQHGVNA
jgi:hypothetical protein